MVHQPGSPSIWPSVQSYPGGVCPLIQGLQCGAYVGAVEEIVCVVYERFHKKLLVVLFGDHL